jgi:hypothetical protein
MKGYFSQLARHTGISFDTTRTTAAGSFSIEPGVAARSAVTPIDVEEVAFTTSSQTNDSDVSEARKVSDIGNQGATAVSPGKFFATNTESTVSTIEGASSMQTEPGLPHKASAIPGTDVSPAPSLEETRIQFTDSQPETEESRVAFAKEQFFSGEQPFDQFPGKPTVEMDPRESIERDEIVAGRLRALGDEAPRYETQVPRVENPEVQRLEARSSEEPPPPQPAGKKERSEAALADQLERDRIGRDQIKEVMAWVAATPEDVEKELWSTSPIEAQPEAGDLLARERGPHLPSSRQPVGAKEAEVQDLSLSIGSISIVIEEPKRDVPVSLTPVPTADRSERAAPEPTRLSRYYLRNW